MKVLIIKTSSMGDVLHTLAALTDAAHVMPDIQFDWVVEENFAEIPAWHPNVKRVIPVAIRRWRKNWLAALRSKELRQFLKSLRQEKYDLIVDMQGLVKSALITRLARGKRAGLNRNSAWESIAALCYQEKIAVNPKQHAITRMRQLLSRALNYKIDEAVVNYGLQSFVQRLQLKQDKPFIMFIHGTTWKTKCWPEQSWCELANKLSEAGWDIKIPWGNEEEQQRAKKIAQQHANIEVLPKLKLIEVAAYLATAKAVVAVDTGLSHLTAALATPCVSLYGPTHPDEVGALGQNQIHLKAKLSCDPACSDNHCVRINDPNLSACMSDINPIDVEKKLESLHLL